MSRDSETSMLNSTRESDSDLGAETCERLVASAPSSFTAGRGQGIPMSDNYVVCDLGKSMDQMSDSFFDPGGTNSQGASGSARRRELIRELGDRALETRKISVENQIDCRIRERKSALSELNEQIQILTNETDALISTKSELLEIQEMEEVKIKEELENFRMQCSNELEVLREEYCDEHDKYCALLQEDRTNYEISKSRLESQMSLLIRERDDKVKENERVRGDIRDSNEAMIGTRDALAFDVCKLRLEKQLLMEYLRQTQVAVGAPDMSIIPGTPSDSEGTPNAVVATSNAVEVTPNGDDVEDVSPDGGARGGKMASSTPYTQGILKATAGYQPFINGNATMNVQDNVYRRSNGPKVRYSAALTTIHGLSGSDYLFDHTGSLGEDLPPDYHETEHQEDVMDLSYEGGNVPSTKSMTGNTGYQTTIHAAPVSQSSGSSGRGRHQNNQATLLDWSMHQCQRLRSSENAARRMAVMTSPYDGTRPWKEWFNDFMDDMSSNGWSTDEALPQLIRCLKKGPGRMAVDMWKSKYAEAGDFTQLVECASELLCGMIAEDPMMVFKKRSQKPNESYRVFGLELQSLLHRARPTMDYDDEYFLNDLITHFVEGLRDKEFQVAACEAWRSHSTLNDVFLGMDSYSKKRTLLAGKVPQRNASLEVERSVEGIRSEAEYEIVEFEETDGTISSVRFPKDSTKKFIPRAAWLANKQAERELELSKKVAEQDKVTKSEKKEDGESKNIKTMFEEIMMVLKGTMVSTKQPVKNNNPAENKCYRCQEIGHFSGKCPAPKPVFRTSAMAGEEEEISGN